jgi:hypothetical protein
MASNRNSNEYSFLALPSNTSSHQYAKKNPLYETYMCCYVTWYSWLACFPYRQCVSLSGHGVPSVVHKQQTSLRRLSSVGTASAKHSPEKQKKHSPVKSQDIMRRVAVTCGMWRYANSRRFTDVSKELAACRRRHIPQDRYLHDCVMTICYTGSK